MGGRWVIEVDETSSCSCSDNSSGTAGVEDHKE